MVRLHCDASTDTGFATYFPDHQGRSHGLTGPSRDVIRSTGSIAHLFHRVLARGLKGLLKDNGLKSDDQTAVGRSQGALTGSIFSKVPVVLVEMCVLTNRHDEALMVSARGQKAMVRALAKAVEAAAPLSSSSTKPSVN